MPNYTITGRKQLYGSVRVGGAKNASFKLMIAALLANTPSRLLNFSHISDVALVAEIINSLGASAQVMGERAYTIDPTNLSRDTIPEQYGRASRASTLFIPALLSKFGRAVVALPGGDQIGARPLDRHFAGFEALGAHVEVTSQAIIVTAPYLVGTTYRFEKNTHTGTETLIMAAVLARGQTILENAAEETEIDNLIGYLNAMGAHIRREPGRRIIIDGVSELHGSIFRIMSDQNQVVSFACAALATQGDIIVENAHPADLRAFITELDQAKAGYEIGQYGMRFFYKQPLQPTHVVTAIHPGFKTDWQPLWVTLMTQADGISTLHETVYENRFAYVDSLNQMGAKIELYNPAVSHPETVYNFNYKPTDSKVPHAARIYGGQQLHSGEFEVKDLRHGATLMIAGMIANGHTILHDRANHIARGYENFAETLCSLGAEIAVEE